MLTGKQRAYLRKLSHGLPVKYQIGKGGFDSDAFLNQLSEGLEKNELIKLRVLDNADLIPREASDRLSELLGCDAVQTIGNVIVLFRPSQEDPQIILP